MNAGLIEALEALEKEKGISSDMLIESIELAMVSAYKKAKGFDGEIIARMDRETGDVHIYIVKTVVERLHNLETELSLEEAQEIDPRYQIGDRIQFEDTPKDFGRIGAQTARQVITQRLREAEKGAIYDEYAEKQNELLTAFVHRVENDYVFVELGRTEGVLPPKEQIPGEVYKVGDRIKVYVVDVRRGLKGLQITVSRSHPQLIKRLFELESPEIQSGVVRIVSIAREPGSRAKIAVVSEDPAVDPLGACVGAKGARVSQIVSELNDEKIDVIKWSPDPAEYIANALSPAKVIMVNANEKEKVARVVVPDNQLSLAIGKEGQNARLTARLTGWKIDIKCQSQLEEQFDAQAFEAQMDEHEQFDAQPFGNQAADEEFDPMAFEAQLAREEQENAAGLDIQSDLK